MNESADPVAEREESMQVQLAGASAALSAEEAQRGLAEAQRELADGVGAGYGLGFGYVKSFGSPRGLDGVQLEYAITDGERVANVHVIVSGTRLAILGYERGVVDPDEQLKAWVLEQLYQRAGSIARSDDRYRVLLQQHPLRVG